MAGNIDELTVNYEEDEVLLVKELEKAILTRGAWTTIVFKFCEWNKKNEEYGPDKVTIRRYQKRGDEYWLKSKFNISNMEQAQKIVDILTQWIKE